MRECISLTMQALIERSEGDSSKELERVQKLRALCEEFANRAKQGGKVIIEELRLENKTIKPITE